MTLPICLASGVLSFAPLGPEHLAWAAAAGIYGAVYGGLCAALVSNSSFVVSSPRTGVALVQANLAAALAGSPGFAGEPAAMAAAIGLCLLIAGLWQVLFAISGIARIIKFTPHPVLAGFLNSIALLIIVAQLKPYVLTGDGELAWPTAHKIATLAFVMLVAGMIIFFDAYIKKVPALLVGLLSGTVLFYLLRTSLPDLDLGGTVGDLAIAIVPHSPLAGLASSATREGVIGAWSDILVVSLAIAVVATFDSLFTLRTAQNLSELRDDPKRNIIAQGIGNCAAALAGGSAIAASPSQTIAAYRVGGRTRLVSVVATMTILAIAVTMPATLASIPSAVLSSLLLATGIQLFDRWSFRLVRELVSGNSSVERRGVGYDLSVVAVVTAVTVSVSVVAGILAGFVLACGIFIVGMSRPIVRRHYVGVSSKRVRSQTDAAILRRSAPRRIVLELEGVLFFGNADDLSRTVTDLFAQADMIVLDFRGITNIDISGETILGNLARKRATAGNHLLFCNVTPSYADVIRRVVSGAEEALFHDLESSLEWMEEQVLEAHGDSRFAGELLTLEQHDIAEGLHDDERAHLLNHLIPRQFEPGATVLAQGDGIGSMFLLMQGSVSVRLHVSDSRGSRRIASLAMGALIGGSRFFGMRLGTVLIADEKVMAYEFPRAAFELLLRDHPTLAAKLLMNIGRELTRRLQTTFNDFREMSS